MLTIDGVTVPVRRIERGPDVQIGGGYLRAHDGSILDQSRGQKRVWRVETTLLSDTDYTAVEAALAVRTEVAIGGTLIAAIAGRITLTGERTVSADAGKRRGILFEFIEA